MKATLSIQQNTSSLFIRSKKEIQKIEHPWLQQLKGAFLKELSNPSFPICTLASHLFMSERQLHRRIKKLTGMTANSYLRQLRLEQAYSLLSKGQCSSIKEVSRAVGFKRTDYFSNLFKANFGQHPKELVL